MLYRIEWDSDGLTPAELKIPAFLHIDSLPLRDSDSNLYPSTLVFHVHPHDYPERTDYPNCFAPVITYSAEGDQWIICGFTPATMEELETYIANNPDHNRFIPLPANT